MAQTFVTPEEKKTELAFTATKTNTAQKVAPILMACSYFDNLTGMKG